MTLQACILLFQVLGYRAAAQYYAHPPDYGAMCAGLAPCPYLTMPNMGAGMMMPVHQHHQQQYQLCVGQFPGICVPTVQQQGIIICVCTPYQQPMAPYPGGGGGGGGGGSVQRPAPPSYYPQDDYTTARPPPPPPRKPSRRRICHVECDHGGYEDWDFRPQYEDEWDWVPDRRPYRRPRCRLVCSRPTGSTGI
ncbi:hypothetical protein BDW75DRAFT_226262 [Aspergillus navahoensis]